MLCLYMCKRHICIYLRVFAGITLWWSHFHRTLKNPQNQVTGRPEDRASPGISPASTLSALSALSAGITLSDVGVYKFLSTAGTKLHKPLVFLKICLKIGRRVASNSNWTFKQACKPYIYIYIYIYIYYNMYIYGWYPNFHTYQRWDVHAWTWRSKEQRPPLMAQPPINIFIVIDAPLWCQLLDVPDGLGNVFGDGVRKFFGGFRQSKIHELM